MIPELTSAADLATRLHVDPVWLRRLVKVNNLEHVRGKRGSYWFTEDQAVGVIDAMTVKAAPKPKPTIAQVGKRRSA